MRNEEQLDDIHLVTSDVDSDDKMIYETGINSSTILTQSRPTAESENWLSEYTSIPPRPWTGSSRMKVAIPETIEGFYKLFFTNAIFDFIYKLTIKKQISKFQNREINQV